MTFKVDLLTDLSIYLDADEFAVSATLNSNTFNVLALTEEELLETGESLISSANYGALAKTSDVSAAVKGDILLFNSISYTVVKIGFFGDDEALTVLQLQTPT